MKKKFNNFFLLGLSFLLLFILGLSWIFWNNTKKLQPIKEVNSCEILIVDSIKSHAVRDTVSYFMLNIAKASSLLSSKDSIIASQKSIISRLRRDRDSISIRLQMSRQKNQQLQENNKTNQ